MTAEERAEVVLRARAAARSGRGLASNPYDREKQADLWMLWRFVFADASPDK